MVPGAVLLAPPPLWAAEGASSIPNLLLVLAAMLIAAKLLGEAAERIGQPAVLGELVAGVLLGSSALGIIPSAGPSGEFIHILAELGVILLLFEIGLETDLKEMFRVGTSSLAVALVGVALPFAFGLVYWLFAPHPGANPVGGELVTAAIFVGATLTATSVGITARVLSDLGQMHTEEAKIIIGAAVIDDVLGLVILTVVSGIAAGTAVSVAGVSTALALAFGFLIVAVGLGNFVAPKLFDFIDQLRVRHVLVVFAFAFALTLAALATLAGSALIIGAFAAGIILSGTNQFDSIESRIRPVAGIFAPIFFVSVGSSVNLNLLNPATPEARATLVIATVLTVLAIAGKVAAGWAAPWAKFRRGLVGVGMVPRGEVGLIFADIGRRTGVLSQESFGAVLLMVMATTFVAPPALKILFKGTSDTAESKPTKPPIHEHKDLE
ncbi:MAG TPA: cation:proton antiporter [Gemmatimonadales bacterium]|nr:cation:proton antiporter [Gemmatimonadales bacterium]